MIDKRIIGDIKAEKDWLDRLDELYIIKLATVTAQRDKLLEALKLLYSLHKRACKDVDGCPYDCAPGEDCETCLPVRAEEAAREAIKEVEGL